MPEGDSVSRAAHQLHKALAGQRLTASDFRVPRFATLNLAGWTRKLSGKPTITVGSVGLDGEFQRSFQGEGAPVRDIGNLLDRLEAGEFDLVAVGRALLQDPEWAAKVLGGRFGELRPYDAGSLKSLS